ncbi:MAG TPA: hypothetical protein VHU91_09555, partial [Mycobacteriales bacterium]|nr:hypothetical protein [Mycobacteriales bacterium]
SAAISFRQLPGATADDIRCEEFLGAPKTPGGTATPITEVDTHPGPRRIIPSAPAHSSEQWSSDPAAAPSWERTPRGPGPKMARSYAEERGATPVETPFTPTAADSWA